MTTVAVIVPALCNTDLCVTPPKRCPDSGVDVDENNVPLRECSGHGNCSRGDLGLQCREGDPCLAVCVCDAGYDGFGCSVTTAALSSAQQLVTTYIGVLVSR